MFNVQLCRTQREAADTELTVPLCVSTERRLYLLLAWTILIRVRVTLLSMTSIKEAHNGHKGGL